MPESTESSDGTVQQFDQIACAAWVMSDWAKRSSHQAVSPAFCSFDWRYSLTVNGIGEMPSELSIDSVSVASATGSSPKCQFSTFGRVPSA